MYSFSTLAIFPWVEFTCPLDWLWSWPSDLSLLVDCGCMSQAAADQKLQMPLPCL